MKTIQSVISKVLDSSVTHYVFIPILIFVAGWIKDACDKKKENKKIGCWLKTYRKPRGFYNMMWGFYKLLGVSFFCVLVVREILEMHNSKLISYIISDAIYLAISAIITRIIWKCPVMKSEFLSHGTAKKILTIALYVIYVMYCITSINTIIALILFTVGILLWRFFLCKYSDVTYIFENRYADIYIKGNDKIEAVSTMTIRKNGNWIIANRIINECKEEIRIREDDIVRVDYYGEPIIINKKL